MGTDMNKNSARKRRTTKGTRDDFWELRLYIAGQTHNSVAAIANLNKICEGQLRGKYRIEVIDLLKKPQLATGNGRSDRCHSNPGEKAPAACQENRWKPLQDRACISGIGYQPGH